MFRKDKEYRRYFIKKGDERQYVVIARNVDHAIWMFSQKYGINPSLYKIYVEDILIEA